MSRPVTHPRALEQMHRRRRAEKRHRLQSATLGWTMAGLVFLAVTGLLADRLMDPAAFPIRELSFEGEFNHLEPEVLRKKVASAIDANYFGIDLKTIERAAESLEWVRKARVRRVWPDGLHVSVEEHRLAARWGNDAWLNEEGDVVRVSIVEQPEVLRLAGPEGSGQRVRRHANEWSARLNAVGLELKALTLNERLAWYAVLARQGGAIFSVALGRDGVQERFDRFIQAFQALPPETVSLIDHVDARYPNGIALRLNPASNPEDSA